MQAGTTTISDFFGCNLVPPPIIAFYNQQGAPSGPPSPDPYGVKFILDSVCKTSITKIYWYLFIRARIM